MDMATLREMLGDHQLYHSDWQIDHAITESHGGTAYGCYVQALRELFRRYRGVKELYLAREKLLNQIAELEDQLTGEDAEGRRPMIASVRAAVSALFRAASRKKSVGRFRVREWEIELARHRMGMEDLEMNIADTEREFRRFYAQCEALKGVVGRLTPERRAELDLQLWKQRFGAMVAIEVNAGQLQQHTIELLATCPREWQQEFLQTAAEVTNLHPDCQTRISRLLGHLGEQTYKLQMPELTDNGRSVQALLEGDTAVSETL
jgi:hypothetical protein